LCSSSLQMYTRSVQMPSQTVMDSSKFHNSRNTSRADANFLELDGRMHSDSLVCCGKRPTVDGRWPCRARRHRMPRHHRPYLFITSGGTPIGCSTYSRANPTAGGPMQSLTSEMRLTPQTMPLRILSTRPPCQCCPVAVECRQVLFLRHQGSCLQPQQLC
jgi:hypothetical protein